jgi:putative membrane protein
MSLSETVSLSKTVLLASIVLPVAQVACDVERDDKVRDIGAIQSATRRDGRETQAAQHGEAAQHGDATHTRTSAVAEAGNRGADAGALGQQVQPLTDGQLLFVADTANLGEVEQARVALPKLSNDSVRAFARDMLDDHQAARDELLGFSDEANVLAAPSPLARDVAREGQAVQQNLLVANNGPVDELYIDSQVEAHAEALALFDQLIAAADSSDLRDLLGTLRDTVDSHHSRVIELQRSLSTPANDVRAPQE